MELDDKIGILKLVKWHAGKDGALVAVNKIPNSGTVAEAARGSNVIVEGRVGPGKELAPGNAELANAEVFEVSGEITLKKMAAVGIPFPGKAAYDSQNNALANKLATQAFREISNEIDRKAHPFMSGSAGEILAETAESYAFAYAAKRAFGDYAEAAKPMAELEKSMKTQLGGNAVAAEIARDIRNAVDAQVTKEMGRMVGAA
jgi:hypothetical protein